MEKSVASNLCAFTVVYFLFCFRYDALCMIISCNPAEIGREFEVNFSYQPPCLVDRPYINSHDGVLARCPNFTANDGIKNYIFSLKNQTDKLIISMLIRNITMPEKETNAWFEYYDGKFGQHKCNILFYKRAKYLNCTYNTTKEELKIECISSKMYPKGHCLNNPISSDGTFIAINSRTENCKENNSYLFTSRCTLVVPVANLTSGIMSVNFTVYPNITGSAGDKDKYGTNSTVILNLEMPSVKIDNCPKVVTEGMQVKCQCIRNDTSDLDVKISWYHNASQRNISGNTLVFTVKRATEDVYYCQSEDTFGWKSSPVYYEPKITINLPLNEDADVFTSTIYHDLHMHRQTVSPQATVPRVSLILIIACGIVGMLIIFSIFCKDVIELRMYSNHKCISKRTVELNNIDIYNISLAFEIGHKPLAEEIQRAHRMCMDDRNYNTMNTELFLKI